MKLGLWFVAAMAAFTTSQSASAATIGQIDTFQDGTTNGWFAGGLGTGAVPPVAPQVVPDGGPLGAGDQYLQITGLGGAGAGSRMVAINSSQWAGDYLSSGISGIAMDLRNFGNSDLTIRLLLEDPVLGPPADVAVTTFGFALPAGGGWTHAFFAIAPSSMTALSGDVDTLLGNTTFLRIIDSPTPAGAVPIVGVLGVDNISAVPDESAVPEPATWLPVFGVLVWLVAARRAPGRGFGRVRRCG